VLSLVDAGGLVLFALTTLRVERGASRSALTMLQQTPRGGWMRRAPASAGFPPPRALTYVASLPWTILSLFLALVLLAEAGRYVATCVTTIVKLSISSMIETVSAASGFGTIAPTRRCGAC
jgi:uncharacterized membrane protein YphA (DoxX/SURF4 family)